MACINVEKLKLVTKGINTIFNRGIKENKININDTFKILYEYFKKANYPEEEIIVLLSNIPQLAILRIANNPEYSEYFYRVENVKILSELNNLRDKFNKSTPEQLATTIKDIVNIGNINELKQIKQSQENLQYSDPNNVEIEYKDDVKQEENDIREEEEKDRKVVEHTFRTIPYRLRLPFAIADMEYDLFGEKEIKLLSPQEKFIFDIIRNITNKIRQSNAKNASELSFPSGIKGLYLTAVSHTKIPEDKLRETHKKWINENVNEEEKKRRKEIVENSVVMVITDKDGNFVYFDKDFNVSYNPEDTLAYYVLHTPKEEVYKTQSGEIKKWSIGNLKWIHLADKKEREAVISRMMTYNFILESLKNSEFINNKVKAWIELFNTEPQKLVENKVLTQKEIDLIKEKKLNIEEVLWNRLVLDYYSNSSEQLYKLKTAIQNNKELKVIHNITQGVIESSDYEDIPWVKLSELSEKPEGFEVKQTGTNETTWKGYKVKPRTLYITTAEMMGRPIEAKVDVLDNNIIEYIADILSSEVKIKDVYGKEKILTTEEKIKYIKPILLLGGSIQIDSKSNTIKFTYTDVKGNELTKVIELKPENNGVIIEMLKTPRKYIKQPNYTKPLAFYHIYNVNIDAINLKNEIPILKKEGEYYKEVNENYWNFISPKISIKRTLVEGKIVPMNSIFLFKIRPEEQVKIEVKQERKETEKKESESAHQKTINSLKNLNREKLLKEFGVKEREVDATLEQIKAAKEWYENSELSKYIPFEVVFSAVNHVQQTGVASFTRNGITIFQYGQIDANGNPIIDEKISGNYTDLYHEAWHGFTQLFLTPEQRKEIYDEQRKRSGYFTDNEGKLVLFSEATDLQLEEYLAEQFREYMLTNKKNINPQTPKTNTFFRKLWNFLRALFSGYTIEELTTDEKSISKINELFEKLKNNNIKEFNFDINNANFDVLHSTLKPLDEKINESRNYYQSQLILKTIDSLLSEYIDILNMQVDNEDIIEFIEIRNKYFSGKASKEEIIKYEQWKQKRVFNFTSQFFKHKEYVSTGYNYVLERLHHLRDELDDKIANTEGYEKTQLVLNRDLINFAIENFGNPNEPIESYLSGRGVIAYHIEKTSYIKPEDIEDMIANEIEEKELTFIERIGNDKDHLELAAPSVLYLLKSVYKVNEKGEFVKNELGAFEPVETRTFANKIIKETRNAADFDNFIYKLQEAAKRDPEINQIFEKLGHPGQVQSRSEHQAWSEFYKTFSLSNVDLILMYIESDYRNEKRNVRTTVSTAYGGYHKIKNDWIQNFNTVKDHPFIKNEENTTIFDLAGVLKKWSEEKIEENPIGFLQDLGINISNTTKIEKIIRADKKIKLKYFRKHLQKILNSNKKINNLNQLFEAAPGEKEHQFGILTALAKLESLYSTTVINFSVDTASGTRQYTYTLNNTITLETNLINSKSNYSEVVNDKRTSFLSRERNPFMRHSIWLNSLYNFQDNGNRRKAKTSIEEDGLIYLQVFNFNGTHITDINNGNVGQQLAKMDIYSKMITDVHAAIMKGIFENPRHADKTSSYSTRPSVIYINGEERMLYFNTEDFVKINNEPAKGLTEAVANHINYLKDEHDRVLYLKNIQKKINNGETIIIDEDYLKNGQKYVNFGGIISKETLERLHSIDEPLESYFKKNPDFQNEIAFEIRKYFNDKILEFKKKYNEAPYFASELLEMVQTALEKKHKQKFTEQQVKDAILASFVVNYITNSYEATQFFYGDNAQFSDAHKRIALAGSTGTIHRTDDAFLSYINNTSIGNGKAYARSLGIKTENYDGTFNTIVIEDDIVDLKQSNSEVYNELYEATYNNIKKERFGNKTLTESEEEEVKRETENLLLPYREMKPADGQGWITLDAYKYLLESRGEWTHNHEQIYRDIISGKEININDVHHFFPVQKVQYFGYLMPQENQIDLPMTAAHKFSLFPLIPPVIKGTKLEVLHMNMMKQNVDYALMKSGSKVASVSKFENKKAIKNKLVDENGNVIVEPKYVINKIHVHYLKNQLNMHTEYKEEIILPTQLRKLIELGLKENGKFTSTEAEKLFNEYQNNLKKLFELKEKQLLEEIQGKKIYKDGKLVKIEYNTEKLIKLLKRSLENNDLAAHEIDFIQVRNGKFIIPLDLSLSVEKIEKVLLSIVNKRLIRFKVLGEGLVQVSSYGFDKSNIKASPALKFYRKDKDGKTLPAQVKIALQGEFKKLLHLKDNEGNTIKTLERLNQMLKDEKWREKNKQFITIVSTRIPVQGHNSMEFFEIEEFLDPSAGNVIIVPQEIVAKAGSDFDVDKLFTAFPYINATINYIDEEGKQRSVQYFELTNEHRLWYENNKDKDIKTFDKKQKLIYNIFKRGYYVNVSYNVDEKTIAGASNKLLQSIVEILRFEGNYFNLIRPNSTNKTKPVADRIGEKISEIQKVKNKSEAIKDREGSTLYEPLYNLDVHQKNKIGKETLGISAKGNTGNAMNNNIGMRLPEVIKLNIGTALKPVFYNLQLLLPHNVEKENDKKYLSLSKLYDVTGKNYIPDIISQFINGFVDIAKDPWIANIQGNEYVYPNLEFLVEAGVDPELAMLFVSIPMIREYVKQQELANSAFGSFFGYDTPYKKSAARNYILEKYFSDIPRNSEGNITNSILKPYINRKLKKEVFEDPKLKEKIENQLLTETIPSELQKMIFLHYLQIEELAAIATKPKMVFNFDTNPSKSFYENAAKKDQIKSLYNSTFYEKDVILKYLNETPVGIFFVQHLMDELFKEMMPLRNNVNLNSFISYIQKTESSFIKNLVGDDIEKFEKIFKNALMSYIFQNSLSQIDISSRKVYKGYNIVITKEKLNDKGVLYKDNTLYINREEIERQYRTKEFAKQKSWGEDTVGAVPEEAFKTLEQYINFVIEREYLRTQYNKEKLQNNIEYKRIYEINKNAFFKTNDLTNEEYEKLLDIRVREAYLRNKALDNTFNIWKMFHSNNSYAKQFQLIMNKYKELKDNYSILNELMVVYDEQAIIKTRSSIKDSNLINVYHEQLLNLSNPSVKKVSDEEENKFISEFFQRFSIFAFLQSGLNTTGSYSLIRLVDSRDYVNLMMNTLEQIINTINKDASEGEDVFLSNFFEVFKKNFENKANKKRILIQNWISPLFFYNKDEKISKAQQDDTISLTQFDPLVYRLLQIGEKNWNNIRNNLEKYYINTDFENLDTIDSLSELTLSELVNVISMAKQKGLIDKIFYKMNEDENVKEMTYKDIENELNLYIRRINPRLFDINQTSLFEEQTEVLDVELVDKIQKKLKELFPEIAIELSNNIKYQKGEDVYNQIIEDDYFEGNLKYFSEIEKISNMILNKLTLKTKMFNGKYDERITDIETYKEKVINDLIQEIGLPINKVTKLEELKNILMSENLISIIKNKLDEINIYKDNILSTIREKQNIKVLLNKYLNNPDITKYDENQQRIIKTYLPALFKDNKKSTKQQLIGYYKKRINKDNILFETTTNGNLINNYFKVYSKYQKLETLYNLFKINEKFAKERIYIVIENELNRRERFFYSEKVQSKIREKIEKENKKIEEELLKYKKSNIVQEFEGIIGGWNIHALDYLLEKNHINEELAIIKNNGYTLDKTPNGKKSLLYESILLLPEVNGNKEIANKIKSLVYSDEFMDWFGDWINDPENTSKIVDQNGEPKLVYHGSGQSFEIFSKEKRGSTTGKLEDRKSDSEMSFMFTDDISVAFSYALLERQYSFTNLIYYLSSTAFNPNNKDILDMYEKYPFIKNWVNKLKEQGLTKEQIIEEFKKIYFEYNKIRDLKSNTLSVMFHNLNQQRVAINFLEENKNKILKNGLTKDIGKWTVATAVSTKYNVIFLTSHNLHYDSPSILADGTLIKFENRTLNNRNIKELTSEEYDEIIKQFKKDYEKLYEEINDRIKAGGFKINIYPVFLNIRNANEKDFKGRPYVFQEGDTKELLEKRKTKGAMYEVADLVEEALTKNLDGSIIKNISDPFVSNNYAVFESNQIKSLFNYGTFDKQNDNMYYQIKNNKIIGQAHIKALKILIDLVNMKTDTLPHEYAHFYIAWYRNTPIVQEAIKKWGSEEALVQSIGEQVVKQKGEAYTWWLKFIEWIKRNFSKLSKLEKEQLTQILTNAFLTRTDLNQFNISNDNNPELYILHSGGAVGSDSYWGAMATKYNIGKQKHYYHKTKTPTGNTPITDEELNEGIQKVKTVCKILNRPDNPSYYSLHGRNWFQVKNADAVFAIGELLRPGEKGSKYYSKANKTTVDGGTGYAVEMAILTNKPVYIYNQKQYGSSYERGWYRWNGEDYEKIDTPTLTINFAGIGTRQLNEYGKKAIEDVYRKTFINQHQTDLGMSIEEFKALLTPEQLIQFEKSMGKDFDISCKI